MSNYTLEIVFDAHQNDWSIPDTPENKKKVHSLMGERFKHFKTDLVRKYLRTNRNPCGPHSEITQRQWEIFCQQRTRPEWLVQFN